MSKKFWFIFILFAALILSIIFLKSCFKDKFLLPEPTGQFAVGVKTVNIIDPSRKELHSENQNDLRELSLQVFYPTDITAEKNLYIDKNIIEIIKKDISNVSGIHLEKLNYLNSLKSNSVANASISDKQISWPVIIFSPGWGMPTNLYTLLLEDLASHGYIVIGINYPYVTNPVELKDGRLIFGIEQPKDSGQKKKLQAQEMQTWLQDIKFVIDHIQNLQINFQAIGIFGHSFGGSVALEACRQDSRLTACVDIEGKLYDTNSINKPVMFIAAPHAEDILKPVKDFVDNNPTASYVELNGTNHGSFTDLYLIAKFKDLPKMDPLEGIKKTRELLVNFFNKYLKSK